MALFCCPHRKCCHGPFAPDLRRPTVGHQGGFVQPALRTIPEEILSTPRYQAPVGLASSHHGVKVVLDRTTLHILSRPLVHRIVRQMPCVVRHVVGSWRGVRRGTEADEPLMVKEDPREATGGTPRIRDQHVQTQVELKASNKQRAVDVLLDHQVVGHPLRHILGEVYATAARQCVGLDNQRCARFDALGLHPVLQLYVLHR
mmetsp:Transcript_20116/g.52218  ORF Transcript_20116/g.52218 Transcript_20116/m.52218 type:complete len:202 (-) Transcript_20116:817-1422(-)